MMMWLCKCLLKHSKGQNDPARSVQSNRLSRIPLSFLMMINLAGYTLKSNKLLIMLLLSRILLIPSWLASLDI